MKKVFIIILMSALFFNGKAQVNGVLLSDTANIKLIQVWGNHYERGYAQGYLLANEIYDIYTNYLLPQFGTSMPLAKQIIEEGQHISIDAKYANEAMGMVNGMALAGIDTTGVDYLDLLVANSFLDLAGFSGFKNMENGCSSFMSWGNATNGTNLNGKSVISRHLDWSNVPPIINNQVIVAHIPSEIDEQPWVMIGHAGQIGAISAINNNGLCVFQHMLSDFSGPAAQFNMAYEPIWFTLRNAIEMDDYNNDSEYNCNDIYDAIAFNQNGYADGFIVTALSPSTAIEDSMIAMVAELAPLSPLFTFRHNNYFDSIPGDNLYAANYEIKRNDHRHWCFRYLGVANNIGTGTNISDKINWTLMRDFSNASTGNIQFMQFVPEDRYFNLSVYRNGTPAYLNDSIRYYLDDLFNTTSIKKANEKTSDFKIFPNPFNKTTTLYFDNNKDEIFNLSIYSIKGDIVKSVNNISGNTFEFSRDTIPNGVYILKLEGSKGTNYKDKIVID